MPPAVLFAVAAAPPWDKNNDGSVFPWVSTLQVETGKWKWAAVTSPRGVEVTWMLMWRPWDRAVLLRTNGHISSIESRTKRCLFDIWSLGEAVPVLWWGHRDSTEGFPRAKGSGKMLALRAGWPQQHSACPGVCSEEGEMKACGNFPKGRASTLESHEARDPSLHRRPSFSALITSHTISFSSSCCLLSEGKPGICPQVKNLGRETPT